MIHRILGVLTYGLIVASGVRATFWLPEHVYSSTQIILLNVSGVVTILGGLVCLIAHATYKWRWESISVWFTVLGLSGFTLVSAATQPPQHITQFVTLITAALCITLMYRGVSLYAFSKLTKE